MQLQELIKDGYFGTDANLETSLFEYGNACKENKDGSFDIIFGVGNDGEKYTSFDIYSNYTESDFEDLITSDWFNIKSVLSFVGMTKKDWMKCSLNSRLDDCKAYYGFNNIFGDAYYPFEIES